MKQISLTILKVLIIIFIMNLIFIPISEASWGGDIISQGDKFLEDGKNQDEPIDGKETKEEFDKIYNILLALGIILSVLVGAVLGIKYMFGSIEEQVKVKETLFPYLIGCIVIFSAFVIWRVVVNIFSAVS